MKKMTLAGLGVVLFSTLALGSQTALATVEQPEANSEATVQFEANTDPELPPVVIPPVGNKDDEAAIDLDGSDGSIGDGNPSFNIAYVSNFRFNERTAADTDFTKFKPIKLNANGMTLWAKGTQLTLDKIDKTGEVITPKESTVYENIPNFVQVVDNRGKLSGWNLEVEAGAFKGKDADDKEVTLKGATITLTEPTIKGPAGITVPSAYAPTTFASEQELTTDAAKPILNAAPNAGIGSWSVKFGQEETLAGTNYETLVEDTGVKLTIPATAEAKANIAYKANLKWTLTDGPK
ncbi:WxL domain-containing protein [Enterococcus crotali]|uniref:WxL domain-containing protein n=1 Tax=Enterococcus crotali TaxID=1453587 RepID=UPI0004703A88|nr:WxL domain-containing protein [Enterococcus crotali]